MKKHKADFRMMILAVSIAVFLGAIGFGYAYWNGIINLSSLISTGRIHTVFDTFEVLSETSPAEDIGAMITGMRLSEDGKSLLMSIDNAYPGYSAEIGYSIKNDGDVPVYCKLITDQDSIASVYIDNPNVIIDPGGGSSYGTFIITISDEAQEGMSSQLNIYLDYVQYNELQ